MAECGHMNFACQVDVMRLTDGDEGPITGYSADVRIQCADCNERFRFIGLPMGSAPDRPMVSFGGVELRAPIEPVSVAGTGSTACVPPTCASTGGH